MKPLLRDVFRAVILTVRENCMWEKFTPEQLEALVTEYLLLHYTGEKQVQSSSKPGDQIVVPRPYQTALQVLKKIKAHPLTKAS